MNSIYENSSSSSKPNSNHANRRIMLFDLKTSGHHANYIHHLIKHWGDNQLQGQLDIVVSPQFVRQHQNIVELASSYQQSTIRFVPISDQELTTIEVAKNTFDQAINNLREWEFLCKYAALLRAEHCLIMYLDTCELPLTLGLTSPCPISGIYFRPTFHYKFFPNQTFSRINRIQQWREQIFLYRALHNPQLHRLFCIDPFVDHHINALFKTNKAIHLADPIEIRAVSKVQVEDLKKKLHIQPDRHIFLLFGLLDDRKGTYKVLEALQAMSPEYCKQICLLLVGWTRPNDQLQVESYVQELRRSQPIQVVTQLEFIPEQEVHTYFHLADTVLAPYQRHIGMSGILLLGAAAQKPILSSNYGLMGELVQQYELGLAIDSTVPNNISDGIIQFLSTSHSELCNISKMKQFTDENLATKFSEVLFQNLDGSYSQNFY